MFSLSEARIPLRSIKQVDSQSTRPGQTNWHVCSAHAGKHRLSRGFACAVSADTGVLKSSIDKIFWSPFLKAQAKALAETLHNTIGGIRYAMQCNAAP